MFFFLITNNEYEVEVTYGWKQSLLEVFISLSNNSNIFCITFSRCFYVLLFIIFYYHIKPISLAELIHKELY